MSRTSVAGGLALATLLTTLASCGGATPTRRVDPSPAEVAFVSAAEALQADVCGCTDLSCLAQVVSDRWEPTFGAAPDGLDLTDAGAARYARAYLGAQRCYKAYIDGPLRGESKAALADVNVLRDRACACADQACLTEVTADFIALSERHKATKGTDRDVEQFKAAVDEMQACVAAVAAPAAID